MMISWLRLVYHVLYEIKLHNYAHLLQLGYVLKQVPSSQPSELLVANQVGYWPPWLATGGVFPGRRPDAHAPENTVLSSAAKASTNVTNIACIDISLHYLQPILIIFFAE